MITFSKFGNYGRLGNQMFQYALLVGIHAKTGYSVIFDESSNLEFFRNFKITIPHFYNIVDIHTSNKYIEERFNYDRSLFRRVDDFTDFEGYFQTEKYFKHCSDLIRKEFTFQDDIYEKAKEFLKPYEGKDIISLHVRRGDYCYLPNHHPLATPDYYKEAISHFDLDKSVIVVVSDDIPWCKENFHYPNMVFSDNDTFTDLCILSLSTHNIIANSSFSWWGAWLNSNPNKIITAPKKWFGPAYSHYNLDDLYIPGSLII